MQCDWMIAQKAVSKAGSVAELSQFLNVLHHIMPLRERLDSIL